MHLVQFSLNKCHKCGELDVLIPYKGNIRSDQEPDRLICARCGQIYAIDLDNGVRQYAPLINGEKVIKFKEEFKAGI